MLDDDFLGLAFNIKALEHFPCEGLPDQEFERIAFLALLAAKGREPESVGMPRRLLAAGRFLAANGFTDEICEGEHRFNIDAGVYLLFADYPDMIEEGRKAIFDGRLALVAHQRAIDPDRSRFRHLANRPD